MTRELKISIFLITGSLLCILMVPLLEEFFEEIFNREFLSRLAAGSSIRLILCLFLGYLVVKKGFLPFNGLSPYSFKNPLLLIISIAVILILAFSSYEYYFASSPKMLALFAFDQALIGIFEELLFRGIVFPLLILHFAGKNKPVLKAVILSSIIFGFIHFVGILRNPEIFLGVLNTVIFASGIGFFMAVFFLKTRNILAPAFLHFLIDFTNGASALKEEVVPQAIPTTETILITLAVLTAMSAFLVALGLFLFKRVRQEEWVEKASLIEI